MENEYRLKLEGSISNQIVIFDTMPALNEVNEAVYSTLTPTHMPYDYHVYDHSSSRTFDFPDIKLVSRNSKEARLNYQKILTLKGWTKPYFGEVTANSGEEMKNWFGAPPEVLYLTFLSNTSGRGNISRVPVVMTRVNMQYANDVDYIPTESSGEGDELGGIPFPLLSTVSIAMMEQHSADELLKFDLSAYRTGTLPAF
jgi:hypothetical protein